MNFNSFYTSCNLVNHLIEPIPLQVFKINRIYDDNDPLFYKFFNKLKEIHLLSPPVNSEKISSGMRNYFLKLVEKINEIIPEALINRHLLRLGRGHWMGEKESWYIYIRSATHPAVSSYMRIHEITELLFLKYEYDCDFDQQTDHFINAHNTAIEIENFYFLVKANNLGLELSLDSLKFLRWVDESIWLSWDLFYSTHYMNFPIKNCKTPTFIEMENYVYFMNKTNFWSYWNKKESKVEDYAWRKWFICHLLPLYDKDLRSAIIFIIMIMEKNGFFNKYEKKNLLLAMYEFFSAFKNCLVGLKHEESSIFCDHDDDHVRDYMKYGDFDKKLWEGFLNYGLLKFPKKRILNS